MIFKQAAAIIKLINIVHCTGELGSSHVIRNLLDDAIAVPNVENRGSFSSSNSEGGSSSLNMPTLNTKSRQNQIHPINAFLRHHWKKVILGQTDHEKTSSAREHNSDSIHPRASYSSYDQAQHRVTSQIGDNSGQSSGTNDPTASMVANTCVISKPSASVTKGTKRPFLGVGMEDRQQSSSSTIAISKKSAGLIADSFDSDIEEVHDEDFVRPQNNQTASSLPSTDHSGESVAKKRKVDDAEQPDIRSIQELLMRTLTTFLTLRPEEIYCHRLMSLVEKNKIIVSVKENPWVANLVRNTDNAPDTPVNTDDFKYNPLTFNRIHDISVSAHQTNKYYAFWIYRNSIPEMKRKMHQLEIFARVLASEMRDPPIFYAEEEGNMQVVFLRCGTGLECRGPTFKKLNGWKAFKMVWPEVEANFKESPEVPNKIKPVLRYFLNRADGNLIPKLIMSPKTPRVLPAQKLKGHLEIDFFPRGSPNNKARAYLNESI